MTQIKICGITRTEDAQLCSELSADYLGFIFVESSPRYIKPERAAAIVSALPDEARPKIVGVFRDQSPEEVQRIAAAVPLDFVQLHGNESNEDIALIDVPVIKALRVGDMLPATTAHQNAEWLLFDTLDDRRGGGTGKRFDWSLLNIYERSRPFFLAGGISPENVAAAISLVRPAAVDVSSGVESEAGIKDATKLRTLFERVRKS